MALEPSGQERSGALLEVGDADHLGHEVVAVELDQWIQIDDDDGNAR